MSKVFVKNGDLKINGVYLTFNDKPVYHKEFVDAQKRAEYVITFANLAKGKDFKGKTPDSLEDLKDEINKLLSNKLNKYIETPIKPIQPITEQLKNEALDFINYNEKQSNSEKVNDLLQNFNIINKFESVGLYFEEDVCELNKIYTIAEIVEAVNSCIELL